MSAFSHLFTAIGDRARALAHAGDQEAARALMPRLTATKALLVKVRSQALGGECEMEMLQGDTVTEWNAVYKPTLELSSGWDSDCVSLLCSSPLNTNTYNTNSSSNNKSQLTSSGP